MVRQAGANLEVAVANQGSFSFDFASVSSLRFVGRAGDDVFTNETNINTIASGNDGNDRITTGGGMDRLFGNVGDDILTSSGGANFINGFSGDDIITGGTGADQVFGFDGNDIISTGDGADRVVAGNGNDTISAGAGNDTVFANSGDCLLYTSPSPRDKRQSRMPSSA